MGMSNEYEETTVGYSNYGEAIEYMESVVRGIEEGVGVKFIKGEELEDVYTRIDMARSLRVAINFLRGV